MYYNMRAMLKYGNMPKIVVLSKQMRETCIKI